MPIVVRHEPIGLAMDLAAIAGYGEGQARRFQAMRGLQQDQLDRQKAQEAMRHGRALEGISKAKVIADRKRYIDTLGRQEATAKALRQRHEENLGARRQEHQDMVSRAKKASEFSLKRFRTDQEQREEDLAREAKLREEDRADKLRVQERLERKAQLAEAKTLRSEKVAGRDREMSNLATSASLLNTMLSRIPYELDNDNLKIYTGQNLVEYQQGMKELDTTINQYRKFAFKPATQAQMREAVDATYDQSKTPEQNKAAAEEYLNESFNTTGNL